MPIDLTHRRLVGELMDDPALPWESHRPALDGLARINAWSGAARALSAPILDFARRENLVSLSLLDVAAGGADVTRALARRLTCRGLNVTPAACDRSHAAMDYAASINSSNNTPQSRSDRDLQCFVLDALREPLPQKYDVIVCSLFLHHLSDADAEALLRHLAAAARRIVVVNDLVRSLWGLNLARVGTRLLSRSSIVHVDGPRSVEAAFTLPEIAALAVRAGLHGATIRSVWPARYTLSWVKPTG